MVGTFLGDRPFGSEPFGREPFDELRVSSRVEKLKAEPLRGVYPEEFEGLAMTSSGGLTYTKNSWDTSLEAFNRRTEKAWKSL